MRRAARAASVGELVHVDQGADAAWDLLLRQTRQIDVLYRAWSRRHGDVEALRELHAAISSYLESGVVEVPSD